MNTRVLVKKSDRNARPRRRALRVSPVHMTSQRRTQLLEDGVQRLQHARSHCIMVLPGCAAALLQYPAYAVLDERVPTACTNGVAMYFNPLFLSQLSDDECAFLYAHEVWHNLLLHGIRVGNRDHHQWNIACDLEVNHILMTHGMKPVAGGWFMTPPVHRAAERWYDDLQRHFSEVKSMVRRQKHNGNRRGGHIWDKSLPQDGSSTADDDQLDLPPSKSRLPVWIRDVQGQRDENVQLEPHPDAIPTATTLVEAMDRSTGKLATQSWKESEAGNVPELPWERLLQDFLERTRAGRLDWNRPSRRHIHRGLYLPSVRGQRLTACIAVDVSGSMWESLREVVTLVRQILGQFDAYDVRLIACDETIEADLMLSDQDPLPEGWEVEGGLGTDFCPVFSLLQGSPPDVLLFITDGWGEFPAQAPEWPVVWLLTQPGEVPFGRALHVPGVAR